MRYIYIYLVLFFCRWLTKVQTLFTEESALMLDFTIFEKNVPACSSVNGWII